MRPVRGRNTSPGFWIPDDQIDALIDAGPLGFAVYGLLGSADSCDAYLAPWRMATLLRVTEEKVWDTLEVMHEADLLTDYDIRAIHTAQSEDPPPTEPEPVVVTRDLEEGGIIVIRGPSTK